MVVSGWCRGAGGAGGAPPPMIQMQSGWGNPQMQTVVAQPTGWANANNQQNSGGDNNGGSKGGSNNNGGGKQTGWATGDFSSYKPPKGNNNQGHFQFNLPTGKPAYIQKLKPIIDLPKIHLHGLGWR
ncbi:hypothetical protein Ocin01_05130 [Orchesella cincta]|uniref:Uncharacterized protein n=1 Tax=Orchesella cincta TaxID=48709 RepID=A0A1D2N8H1_ORCCI|nr:hypothetical protein Ocin01_05130 [Orchesella cincta]